MVARRLRVHINKGLDQGKGLAVPLVNDGAASPLNVTTHLQWHKGEKGRERRTLHPHLDQLASQRKHVLLTSMGGLASASVMSLCGESLPSSADPPVSHTASRRH